MVKRPKISVIIPIYNVEDYLNRCLESVVNQTLFDIEIIGVNDGTKDDSVAIIRKYMALDKRIQLVEKENGGLSSARNAGLEVATGELILFLGQLLFRRFRSRTPGLSGIWPAGMFIIQNFIRMLYLRSLPVIRLRGTGLFRENSS